MSALVLSWKTRKKRFPATGSSKLERMLRQRRKHLHAEPLDPEPEQLDPPPILAPVAPEPEMPQDVLFDLYGTRRRNVHDDVVLAVELKRERARRTSSPNSRRSLFDVETHSRLMTNRHWARRPTSKPPALGVGDTRRRTRPPRPPPTASPQRARRVARRAMQNSATKAESRAKSDAPASSLLDVILDLNASYARDLGCSSQGKLGRHKAERGDGI